MDGFILGGEEFRNVSTLQVRWSAPGPGNDFVLTAHFVYIIDATGILDVAIGEFEISCV